MTLQKNTALRLFLLLVLFAPVTPFTSLALAQIPVQVSVNTEKELSQLNAVGELEIVRVSTDTVVPGDTLVYTIEVSNSSDQPAENVVVTDPVSETISYVEGSVFNSSSTTAADVTFSVDGGATFFPRDQLQIQNASGQLVAALPEQINSIRWQFSEPIPPGTTVQVGFRATVN